MKFRDVKRHIVRLLTLMREAFMYLCAVYQYWVWTLADLIFVFLFARALSSNLS